MARVSRLRSRSMTYRGQLVNYTDEFGLTTPVIVNQVVTRNSSIDDYTGAPVVASTLSSLQTNEVIRVDGAMVSNFGKRLMKVEGYPTLGTTSEFIDNSPLPAKNGWMLDLVAGTNPSRPVLAPPTMLQDLITLPRMIFELGSTLRRPRKLLTAQGAANAHLAARFGWIPLIEDLHKLLDLQALVIKRNKELNQLYSGRGLRRRLKFADDTKVYQGYIQIPGYATASGRANMTVTVKKEQWATIRWFPTAPPPYHPSDERWNIRTKRLILGVTPEGMMKGIWDVIPWTWLLGWFTNIGKFALANSNTIPARHSEGCFMSQVKETRTGGAFVLTDAKGFLNASGTATLTRKTRAVSYTVLVGFNMPYLDMSRLSILGSLGIQRYR